MYSLQRGMGSHGVVTDNQSSPQLLVHLDEVLPSVTVQQWWTPEAIPSSCAPLYPSPTLLPDSTKMFTFKEKACSQRIAGQQPGPLWLPVNP